LYSTQFNSIQIHPAAGARAMDFIQWVLRAANAAD
jgi:hypothetical protein